jgi:predicted nucleotidyltransferase
MKKIRLNDWECQEIIESFESFFEPGDHLWLFGSRADMTRKGGDIDLFIESSLSLEDAYKKKIDFLIDLDKRIGEQRIDVVTYHFGTPSLPIDEEARQTGVRLK